MKIKIIVLLSVIFLLQGNLFGQNFNKMSKEIKKRQLLIQPEAKNYINCYLSLRKKSNCLEKIYSLTQIDTIFMIESLGDWSSLELTSILWNRADTISCSSNDAGKTYNFTKEMIFNNHMIKLVSEWNIEKIRKEEVESIPMQPNYTNFATRIIFHGKQYKIDCIYFKDF